MPRGPFGVAFDALASAVCHIVAYRLRFDGPEFEHFLALSARAWPIMVALHLGALGALGVYRTQLPKLWPFRLAFGTLIGVVLGFGLAVWTLRLEGISRQATSAYALTLIVGSLAWRAGLALAWRWIELRRPATPGGQLEVRGEQYQSMSGGLLLGWAYRDLLRNLVAKDLKLKYRGSVLGFLWSLANPLVMIVVYTVAFTYILRVPTDRYAFFVLIGLLAWTFFAGAVLGSMGAITEGGSLIKSVVFPRIILPVSGVVFHLVQYVLSLAVLLPVSLVWYHIPPGPQMLAFPFFLFLQVLFISGLALLLSTATVFVRDVRHLTEIGINVAFWATPIIYEYTLVPEQFRFAGLLSPMASFVRAYQDIFYYLVWPDTSIWLVATAYGIGAFVCGLSVFVAYEDRFPEQI